MCVQLPKRGFRSVTYSPLWLNWWSSLAEIILHERWAEDERCSYTDIGEHSACTHAGAHTHSNCCLALRFKHIYTHWGQKKQSECRTTHEENVEDTSTIRQSTACRLKAVKRHGTGTHRHARARTAPHSNNVQESSIFHQGQTTNQSKHHSLNSGYNIMAALNFPNQNTSVGCHTLWSATYKSAKDTWMCTEVEMDGDGFPEKAAHRAFSEWNKLKEINIVMRFRWEL